MIIKAGLIMRRAMVIIIVMMFASGLMLSGCETVREVGKTVGPPLKKASKKVDKNVADAIKDLREKDKE